MCINKGTSFYLKNNSLVRKILCGLPNGYLICKYVLCLVLELKKNTARKLGAFIFLYDKTLDSILKFQNRLKISLIIFHTSVEWRSFDFDVRVLSCESCVRRERSSSNCVSHFWFCSRKCSFCSSSYNLKRQGKFLYLYNCTKFHEIKKNCDKLTSRSLLETHSLIFAAFSSTCRDSCRRSILCKYKRVKAHR